MFKTILIANRGEIACRIIDTAQRLGIRCVAVYSDADAEARFVRLADEAHRIGPALAADSYLKADHILEVARACGAQAIHPGYGFLSENAEFARACETAGIRFIGPPASAIEAMGSKSAAKAIMEQAKVPLVPGYHGDEQGADFLREQAQQMGYPMLLKASAGGGGKGMRIVRADSEFGAALDAAKREARASFGDDRMLIEKYIEQPRHVEIQVFADSHGNAVHLFERDCSLQRRHQKVVEEAPAPGMTDNLRQAMGEAAIQCAQAIGYVGAGTVEFLLDRDGHFYFMEMNTRLQVEHPVTECITGQDLVEWQLHVAWGDTLPLAQEELTISGHAFEVRVYAEDPEQGFLPATGVLSHYAEPTHPGVRIDSGVGAGDAITPYYDPMISKLIVHGDDRAHALALMQQALSHYQIAGLTHNLGFLHRIFHHPAFCAAELSTHFIETHEAALLPDSPLPDAWLIAAGLVYWWHEIKHYARPNSRLYHADPWSPWTQALHWRSGYRAPFHLALHHRQQVFHLQADVQDDRFIWHINGGDTPCLSQHLEADERSLNFLIDGQRQRFDYALDGASLTLFGQGQTHAFSLPEHHYEPAGSSHDNPLAAPMNGRVTAVMVSPGDQVNQGDTLLVMEAMKMEHAIKAHQHGTVARLLCAVGDQVEAATLLAELEVEA